MLLNHEYSHYYYLFLVSNCTLISVSFYHNGIIVTSIASFIELPEEQKARGLFFTPREIAQQPDTWKTTLKIFQKHQERICAFLDLAGVRDSLEHRPVVMLIGAGTSDYIGRALELLLRQKWGCEVSAVASTDLLPSLEEYVVPGERYLWISSSSSGESPEGVAVLEQNIVHLVVTCNARARMAEICKESTQACLRPRGM